MNILDLTNLNEKVLLIKRIKIEESLNNVQYRNVGIGSISALYLNDMVVKNGRKTVHGKKLVKIKIEFWISVLSKIKFKKKLIKSADIFFAHYSSKRKDWSILDQLEESLDNYSISRFDVSKVVCQYNLLDLIKYIARVIIISKKLNIVLNQVQQSNAISSRESQILKHYILSHLLFMESAFGLLKKKPRHIICTHDRNRYCSIFISAANALQIKTSVIIHGSSFHLPSGYLMPIAQFVLLWGELQSQIFKSYGLKSERIRIVGFPNMVNETKMNVFDVKSKYNIPQSRKIFLLASQPYAHELSVIKYLTAELMAHPEWQLVIKLHPSSFINNRSDTIKEMDNIFVLPESCSPLEAIVIADLVGGLTSTLLIEAASMKKPLVVLNPTNENEMGIGAYFSDFGNAPLCSNPRELSALISKVEKAGIDSVFNFQEQQEFFKQICKYSDEQSVQQIREHILQNIN